VWEGLEVGLVLPPSHRRY
jgi:hypothetical protein